MRRGGSFVDSQNPLLHDVALWRASRPGRSRVQIRAACLHEKVKLAEIDIRPCWTLAGDHLIARAPIPKGWPDSTPPEAAAHLEQFGLCEEEREQVRRAVRAWSCADGDLWSVALGEPDPDMAAGRGSWARNDSETVYWAGGWMENHSVRDYAKVLRLGFAGIRREVEQCLNQADPSEAGYPRQENFWRAALEVCDAGILLGRRYAELASSLANQAEDPSEQSRLGQIAAVCSRVPAEGARTFREATQSLWFAHILTCGEDGINANSIGRLDQILYPYYEADLRAGRLTRAEAVELMEELACKLYLEYDVQAITLGGVDRDGGDAVNEMSYIILEATGNVDFARDVSVRLNRQSPAAFIDLAAELIVRGGGIPFIFNDECFIPALHGHGIALEDARNYAPIGCIELTIPGKANPHAVSGWLNSTKCLELALFGGKEPCSGRQLGPATGTLAELATYDDLMAAYCRQVEFFSRRMVYHCNRGELAQRERGPLPCWSTLTDDCIARGRDITDGGPIYNYHSICFLGTANTADSLLAIRQLVFDSGEIEPVELLQALRADFEGHEPLRQMLLKRAPKYGNDHPEVDAIARRICEDFIDLMDTMRSPLDGRYFVHLFSFRCNITFGKTVGAMPDGRRAGQPLAYSLSAHQGRDERGLTAMLKSLSRLPHERAAGATAAIIDIDPVLMQGEPGARRMSQIIQTAMEMGVGQLQWNLTTVDRLKQAQEDPERYGNLVVRVAGYSQMFKLIDRELQNHIIARTKHQQ